MTDITRFESSTRMSQAVRHGDTLYLSGQVGKIGDDAATQTRDALAEVDRILAANGSAADRILSVTIWLADMADFDAMNAVYEGWLDHENVPTRATCEAKLASPDYKVEIVVIAAVEETG